MQNRKSSTTHQISNESVILILGLTSAYFFTWEKLGPRYFSTFLKNDGMWQLLASKTLKSVYSKAFQALDSI